VSEVNSPLMLRGWLHPTLSKICFYFVIISWVTSLFVSTLAVQQWAQLAIMWYSFELGSDSEQVQEMQEVVVRPQAHRAWGTRERLEVGGRVN